MLRQDKVQSKAHKVFNRIELNKPLLVPHAEIDRFLATSSIVEGVKYNHIEVSEVTQLIKSRDGKIYIVIFFPLK